MSDIKSKIDPRFLSKGRQGSGGLVLDFCEKAFQLPSGTGKDYLTYTDWRLRGFYFGDDGKELKEKRAKIAESQVIGFFDPFDDDIKITHSSMKIKTADSMQCA